MSKSQEQLDVGQARDALQQLQNAEDGISLFEQYIGTISVSIGIGAGARISYLNPHSEELTELIQKALIEERKIWREKLKTSLQSLTG